MDNCMENGVPSAYPWAEVGSKQHGLEIRQKI